MLERENIDNFIADDLALRNRNWGQIEDDFSGKADKAYVDTELAKKADKQQEAWITPTLLNGATSTGLSYRKNTVGQLEIKGRVTVESAALFMTLPGGYKPSLSKIFTVKNNIPGELTEGVVYITFQGDCRISSGKGTWLLDCIIVLD